MTAAHPLVVEMTRARTERAVTHTDVHDATGIARSTVRNWEAGRRDPQLAAFDTYLRSFGLRLAIVALEEPSEVIRDEQLPYGPFTIGAGETWCAGCRQARPNREFDRDRTQRTGRRGRCKHCRSARRRIRMATRGEAA